MEERFHARGCYTAAQLYELSPHEMTSIWGGIVGDRFFQLIRGINVPEEEHERSSISHSKVLAPEMRGLEAAWPVAIRLLTKACVRLRNERLYAKDLWLSIKYLDRDPMKRKWHRRAKCFETQDSLLLIEELKKLWQELPARPILRVGIALSGLVPATGHQISLFEDARRDALMGTLDAVNGKFNDGALFVADTFATRATPTNSIAFQRIPDENE
jgi:DNA polymerase-4